MDLYHDLTDVFDKGRKQSTINMLSPEMMEEMDRIDFVGMTEDEIEDERKE